MRRVVITGMGIVSSIGDGWLEADGARVYQVQDMRVGLFQS